MLLLIFMNSNFYHLENSLDLQEECIVIHPEDMATAHRTWVVPVLFGDTLLGVRCPTPLQHTSILNAFHSLGSLNFVQLALYP